MSSNFKRKLLSENKPINADATKYLFEWLKHFTTLNTASVVFVTAGSTLLANYADKNPPKDFVSLILIGLICFLASLAISCLGLITFTMAHVEANEIKRKRPYWIVLLVAGSVYITGLLLTSDVESKG